MVYTISAVDDTAGWVGVEELDDEEALWSFARFEAI